MKFQCHTCTIQMPNNKVLLGYNHTHWFNVIYSYFSVTRTVLNSHRDCMA